MKLWYDRKAKDPTYFVQLGIRIGKKVTSKNIAKIGKHSDLLKIEVVSLLSRRIATTRASRNYPYSDA